jgi:hypothetical protein
VKWLCADALGAGSGLLIGAVCGQPIVHFSATLGTSFGLVSCCFCCTSLFCSLLPLHWSIQSSVFMAAKGIEQQEKNLFLFFSMGSVKVDSIL